MADLGTTELRGRKRRATLREDLPLDPSGVLFGRELVDAVQYAALVQLIGWLEKVAAAWGGKTGTVAGLWAALLGAGISSKAGRVEITPGGSDYARRCCMDMPEIKQFQ